MLVKYAAIRLAASIAVLSAFFLGLSLWAGIGEKPRMPQGTAAVQPRIAYSLELSAKGTTGNR